MLKSVRVKALLISLMVATVSIGTFSGCNFSKNSFFKFNSAENKVKVVDKKESDDQKIEEQLKKDKARGLFVLVNKKNTVPNDYKPEDLTEMIYCAEGRDPSTRYMRAEAAENFNKMVEDALSQGIDIVMTTAYRSYGFQNVLWTHNIQVKGSEEEANKTSARPSESEHRTGLAVDISTKAVNYVVTTEFENTDAGKWVREEAHKYGFIIRYPKDKVEETGYSYEAWHLRYVGKTAAKEIFEKNISLEKFLKDHNLATTLNGKDPVFP